MAVPTSERKVLVVAGPHRNPAAAAGSGSERESSVPNRIWVDVEDLFQYSALNARPSGIQRIEFELCRSLALLPETRDRVGFVRHAPSQQSFQAIPFAQIDALHARLTTAPPAVPGRRSTRPRAPAALEAADAAGAANPGLARRIAYRLPLDVRQPLVSLVKSQGESLRAAGRLGGIAVDRLGRLRPSARRSPPAGPDAPGGGGLTVAAFADTAEPGDVLLVLGSTWFHPFYGELVSQVRETLQLRIAVLMYDIIPLLRPEWCDQNLVLRFNRWARALLPQADMLLTISQATGQDLIRFAARAGLTLRSAPVAIPVGTGFSHPVGQPDDVPATARADRLPPARSYVLTVSTIEARKNHALLFRVWRRLLEEMPAERVPTLVFAGKVGWLVDDLMQQLRNARYLDGKLVLIENPQDGELQRLYEGCLFTVFPSFYEGWGLPVTESLGFGRPCIISDASALPEAGGTLARYFDPENGSQALRVIRRAIEDADDTEAWAARVAAEFKRVSWDESAHAMLRAIDHGRPRSSTAAPPADHPLGRTSHLA